MKNFKELVARLQGSKSVKRVAVVAADDAHTLEALLQARKDGVVEPVLVGDSVKIKECLASLGAADANLRIVDSPDHEDAARAAVALIHSGEADFLMKGCLETATLMKVVVNRESGMRTDRIMSHIAFVEIPSYHKILAVTDVAMLTYPDLAQKKQAIENAVGALRKMGIDQPKVAVMSAAEEVNPKLPESADALELKMMNRRGELIDCLVEGPISYDLAMSAEAAAVKRYESPVAGDADLMVVPNITAGNLMLKALVFSGGAKSAGFVVGAKVPIVLTSRASSTEDKYMSVVLAASAC